MKYRKLIKNVIELDGVLITNDIFDIKTDNEKTNKRLKNLVKCGYIEALETEEKTETPKNRTRKKKD